MSPFQVADIQRLVAQAYGIDERLMKQPCRRFAVSRPRQVAMYLARSETQKSYRCLASLFGLDHSIVRRAGALVEQRMAADPAYRARIEELRIAAKNSKPATDTLSAPIATQNHRRTIAP